MWYKQCIYFSLLFQESLLQLSSLLVQQPITNMLTETGEFGNIEFIITVLSSQIRIHRCKQMHKALPSFTLFGSWITDESWITLISPFCFSCFLQKWPLVGGLLVPMAVILLLNIVIFVLVMRQLAKTVAAKQETGKESNRRETVRRLQNAFCILLLLGLTWIIGYLTVISDVNIVIHALFIIINSLQGFFIFVLYCLRQPHVRERWRQIRRDRPGLTHIWRVRLPRSKKNRVPTSISTTMTVTSNSIRAGESTTAEDTQI